MSLFRKKGIECLVECLVLRGENSSWVRPCLRSCYGRIYESLYHPSPRGGGARTADDGRRVRLESALSRERPVLHSVHSSAHSSGSSKVMVGSAEARNNYILHSHYHWLSLAGKRHAVSTRNVTVPPRPTTSHTSQVYKRLLTHTDAHIHRTGRHDNMLTLTRWPHASPCRK